MYISQIHVYGYGTIVGHLMPNWFIYIHYIYMIFKYKSTKLDTSKFTNNSFKHQKFVYTLLNDQTVLFQTIQFSISHLFGHSLNVNQLYLIHR